MRSGKGCTLCIGWDITKDITAVAFFNGFLTSLIFVAVFALLVYLAIYHAFDVPPNMYMGTVQKIGLSFLQMLGVLGIFKARGTKVFNEVMNRPAEVVGGSISSLLPVKCFLQSQMNGPFFINMALPVILPIIAALILVSTAFVEKYWVRARRKKKKAPTYKGKFNLPRFIARCRALRNPMTEDDTKVRPSH